MKLSMLASLFLLASFPGGASSAGGSGMGDEGDIELAMVDYFLEAPEREAMSRKAMQGQADAALALANHYVFADKKTRRAHRWALVAAENGSAQGQFLVYQQLHVSADLLDQERALFWLKRSTDGGSVIARAIHKGCPTLQSRRGRDKSPCFGPGSD